MRNHRNYNLFGLIYNQYKVFNEALPAHYPTHRDTTIKMLNNNKLQLKLKP